MTFKMLCFLLLLFPNISLIETYKTVVVVHGLNADAPSFENVKELIVKNHPGTNVILLTYAEDSGTLSPLPSQMNIAVPKLKKIIEVNKDGIHLLCHSQGGLVCLDAVENLTNHNIDTFISLSGPLLGQYGIPRDIFDNIPELKPLLNLSREFVSPFIYNDFMQGAASIANYWKDPRSKYLEKYERYSSFLPYVHNDPRAYRYNSTDAEQRKKNLMRLNKLVLIGGPSDEVITPWQSALFGYYAANSESVVVDMAGQKIYIDDWIGLRTLDQRGDLKRYSVPGVDHGSWPASKTVTEIYLPYLT